MANKKTIWVINQFAGTADSCGRERHFYFAHYWKEMGYDVKIISSSYNHMFTNNIKVKGLYKHEVHQDIDFYWVKTPIYHPRSVKRFYSMWVFMYRVLQLPVNKIGQPDVIIVSSMPIFSIYSGYKLKKKYKSKLIFEVRDIWPLTLQLLGNKSRYHPAVRFIGWFERFGYRKSDNVVSLLPNAKVHIDKIAGHDTNFHYIPNGIDQRLLKNDRAPSELTNQIPKDKFIIGYTGTIGLANALEYLIEAAIKLKDDKRFYFVIVGDGYLKSELEQKSKGNNNILFYPKVKKDQVQDILKYLNICFIGWHASELYNLGVSANKYFD
ncbi:MAG: glycosyltransferase WbuB, partial [Arcobacter sp.]